MTRIDMLLDDLMAAIKRAGIPKKQLARMAGLHPNTFRTLTDDHDQNGVPTWSPSTQTIRALEQALQIDRPVHDRHVDNMEMCTTANHQVGM